MKRLVYVLVLVLGLTVLFTLVPRGCEQRSELASTGISDEEYERQREARIQARNERIREKNEKARKASEDAEKRAARTAVNTSTYSDKAPTTVPTTVPNRQLYNTKRPSGVTTIGGLDYWRGNLPTKGGNRFIILKQFDNDCGPTGAEMVFHYYGKRVTQSEIWNKGDIHTIDAGTFPGELKRAFNGLGVPVLRLSRNITPSGGGRITNYDPFPSLKRKIRQSKPCIILLQGGLIAYHWVVVVGYDNRDRFLIAEPSGYFKWWNKQKLDKYWGFKNASGHGISGDFINAAVREKAHPYTMIVPKDPPKRHFEPMWSDMQVTQVTGKSRLNIPKFKPKLKFWESKVEFRTHAWKHTFHFPQEYASPDHYTVACLQPLQVRTVFTKGHVEGDFSTTKGEITVWGQIEYGKTTRSKLWILVRVYRKGIKSWKAPKVIAG